MRRLSNILSIAFLALCVLLSSNVAAQSSRDYINKTKQHIKALDDSIKKYYNDSIELQKELDKLPKGNEKELTTKLDKCVKDTVPLSSQINSNTLLLESISLKRDILNDSLPEKVTKFINSLLNSPCNPEAIKSLAGYSNFPSLKGNAQINKDYKLLKDYEGYSTKLLGIVKPIYDALDRNGWQPLMEKSGDIKNFKNGLKNYKKNTYKSFNEPRNNIPLLDRTILSLENLITTNFGDSKNVLEELIFNLTPASYHLESPIIMMETYKAQIDSLNGLNKACNDSLNNKCIEIAKLKQDIDVSKSSNRKELENKLKAIHIKCDDMREAKDIAIFKECLFINLKQPYNDTIINALKGYATQTYFKSYKDFQRPYLPILDNYGTYTDSLYNVMRDCYNNYCRKAGWQRLPNDLVNNVRKRLANQEYYKQYYLRKDKINSPHLNSIISEYLKLMNTGFAGCKTQYIELLTKLRGKKPKPKKAQTNTDNSDDSDNE